MRFWVSASLTFFLCASIVAANKKQSEKIASPFAMNEWKLAGLSPGHTTVKRAEALLGNPQQDDPNISSASWHTCWQDRTCTSITTERNCSTGTSLQESRTREKKRLQQCRAERIELDDRQGIAVGKSGWARQATLRRAGFAES